MTEGLSYRTCPLDLQTIQTKALSLKSHIKFNKKVIRILYLMAFCRRRLIFPFTKLQPFEPNYNHINAETICGHDDTPDNQPSLLR